MSLFLKRHFIILSIIMFNLKSLDFENVESNKNDKME